MTTSDYIAKVDGQIWTEFPANLYIPPAALKVILQQFEGPLDLLLYLIKKHNLDILDVPIAKICEQYMEYIGFMQQLELDLAAEYLTMAAWLTEIKSRLLLPQTTETAAEEDEADPRNELVRRLQEYEQFKHKAEELERLPLVNRDVFVVQVDVPVLEETLKPNVTVADLASAMTRLKKQQQLNAVHQVLPETISVKACMDYVLTCLSQRGDKAVSLQHVCQQPTRLGMAVTFVAVLELTRKQQIRVEQAYPFAEVNISMGKITTPNLQPPEKGQTV